MHHFKMKVPVLFLLLLLCMVRSVLADENIQPDVQADKQSNIKQITVNSYLQQAATRAAK